MDISDSITFKRELYVSKTGVKKKVFTLYHYQMSGVKGVWVNESYAFQKALSTDKEVAMKKANIIASKIEKKFNIDVPVIFEETPRDIFNNTEAFGLSWELTKKSDTFYAAPDKGFWDNWKVNKDLIKSYGFWVYKVKSKFLIFFKPKIEGVSERLTRIYNNS